MSQEVFVPAIDEVICPPDPERIVEGLRDTGYNFNTAVADIIDNSIAANAGKIDILINMNPKLEVTVFIADNGIGMNKDGLINAMKYGSKEREEEGSLGKFGLGLKTASTAFCRSLSVISRGDDKTIRKAQWDLDYVASVHDWTLRWLNPEQEEVELLEATAGDGTGTLVVWEKVDRLLKSYKNDKSAKNAFNKKIEDLKFHVAMVYQRFLDSADQRAENVTITINGVNIDAWDPFALKEELTEELATDEIEVELPDMDETPSFTMRAFMLPNKDSFSTSEASAEARISNDMQGFYVYRENRLIHHGDWLGMFINEPHGSLLRVEFSFDHRLDSAFDVDIKKSRILPADEIMDYIKTSFISAPRRAADERYRRGIAKNVAKKADQRDAHAESNRNIDEKAKAVEGASITVSDNGEVQIQNQHGTFAHKLTVINKPKEGQIRVLTEPDLENGQLWEPCIADGKHAVRINQSHPYYQKVYQPVINQNIMVTGMDALLWALAETEHKTYNADIKELYEEMRVSVSMILKRLVADLPDPEDEDDEE